MTKISIIGSGYVGLCTAAGFASRGHRVTCVDISGERVKNINRGIPPIYEAGLENAMKRAVASKRLSATTDLGTAVKSSRITFITVGTPSRKDGSIDLSQISGVSKQMASALKGKKDYHVVVMKSTVLPCTTENILIDAVSKTKKVGREVGIAVNPEFLREGKAMEDFLSPDRIVVGEYDKRSGDAVAALYRGFGAPVVRTSLRAAEMIKYASNAMLATKISFANEIGNMCKQLGIDTYEVMKAVGMDHRIGAHFLDAGVGFGGSCFPKDVSALAAKAREIGIEPKIIESVLEVNEKQKTRIIYLLKSKLGSLKGRKITILGLAFKSGTDDIRDSVSIDVIRKLVNEGVEVSAYDPAAAETMKKIFPNINYCSSAKAALKGSHACLILTDWPEFSKLRDPDFAAMKNKIVIEGRRILNKNVSNYEGLCW